MQFGLYPAEKNKSNATSVFYGLNRLRRGAQGEMEDMKNMAPFEYPCAAPRGARQSVGEITGDVQAVCAPDITNTEEVAGFTGIAGGAFYYNGEKKSGNISLGAGYSWSVIRFGNLYVLNGYKGTESVMYSYNIDTNSFGAAGVVMDNLIVTAGTDSTGSYLATIQYAYDYVYDYSVTDSSGRVIDNSDFFIKYFKNQNYAPENNIFEDYFKIGDEVSVSGFPSQSENAGQVWSYSTTSEKVTPQTAKSYDENNTADADAYPNIDDISRWQVTNAVVKGFKSVNRTVQHQTTYIHYIYLDLYNKNGDAAEFLETSGAAGSFYCSGITLSSRRRCFSKIAAHHGRIWGVSPAGNTIFGSASDKIFSFTAADINAKYAARLTDSTPGMFTGLCEYNGELVAFKPESLTVVYGTNPLNYNTYTINGAGCIDGNSLCVTPYGVIYLSSSGFYCYSGGAPMRISEKLKAEYISAAAAFAGDVYYAAAVRRDGTRELLTCDLRRGMWHVQDDAEADGIFPFRGIMHMVSGGHIYEMTETEPDSSEWYFTTVPTTAGTLDKKAVNELWIRADVAGGAEFTVETSAGSGRFIKHETFDRAGLHVFRCPVRAVMDTSYRIRISGKGRVVVYDIEVKTAAGGRRYKEEQICI